MVFQVSYSDQFSRVPSGPFQCVHTDLPYFWKIIFPIATLMTYQIFTWIQDFWHLLLNFLLLGYVYLCFLILPSPSLHTHRLVATLSRGNSFRICFLSSGHAEDVGHVWFYLVLLIS